MKVVISGASSGIGEALARHYDAPGNVLGLFSRRIPQGNFISQVAAFSVDVTDVHALKGAARDFVGRFGAPDIVIANAGISIGNLTDEPDDVEVFREILDVNVLGMVNTFHPFIEPMRARGTGSLVGIASVAGIRGLPGATGYSASKAAAIRYLEGLRVELRRTGIAVTTICPGYVRTEMTAKNPYPMPFIFEADDAARRFARVIAARRKSAIIPWQMAIAGRLLHVLPIAIYDAVAARMGRKPRRAK